MKLSRRAATGIMTAAIFTPFASVSAQTDGIDVISLLETEHREAKRLVDGILASNDATERDRLLHTLANALTIHNANEENIVYPAIMNQAGRPDDAAMLYHQQDDSKVIIAELMRLPKTSARFTSRCQDLRTALWAHIHQEEAVDFPALQSALGSNIAALDAATSRLRAHWVANPA
jgi:hypothetical protein